MLPVIRQRNRLQWSAASALCLLLYVSGCMPGQDTAAILPVEQVDDSAVPLMSVNLPELDSTYKAAATLCQRISSSTVASAPAPRFGAHSLLLLRKGHDAAIFSRTLGLPAFMEALSQSEIRYVICVSGGRSQG